MDQSINPEAKPNFIIYNRARFERAVLNLPRVLALEDFAEENTFKDAHAATHLLSRVIIALNGVATQLGHASAGDESVAGRTAAEVADILWAFGEECAACSPNLKMLDDARAE